MLKTILVILLLQLSHIANAQCDNLLGINLNLKCKELTNVSSLSLYIYHQENPTKAFINIDLKAEIDKEYINELGLENVILGFNNQKENLNINNISPEYLKAFKVFINESDFNPNGFLLYNKIKKDLSSKHGAPNENFVGKLANTDNWHFENCNLILSIDKEKRMVVLMHIRK
jgi:hypothetical protein